MPDFESDVAEAGKEYVSQRARHGLTQAEIATLLRAQNGRCAICGTDQPGQVNWSIDHDHRHHPGPIGCRLCVRGILCSACNDALGKMKDDPARLRAAAAYIERTNAIRRF